MEKKSGVEAWLDEAKKTLDESFRERGSRGGHINEADELERVRNELEERLEKQGFLPTEDSTEPGTIYRVPDTLAAVHLVPYPANFVVAYRHQGRDVCVMPVSLSRKAWDGDVFVPPEETPFGYGSMGSLAIHAWLPLRINEEALGRLAPHARIPTVPSLNLDRMMLLSPPADTEAYINAWQKLVTSLNRPP